MRGEMQAITKCAGGGRGQEIAAIHVVTPERERQGNHTRLPATDTIHL